MSEQAMVMNANVLPITLIHPIHSIHLIDLIDMVTSKIFPLIQIEQLNKGIGIV